MAAGVPVACFQTQTILSFASGKLSSSELAAVEAHARQCCACQQLLAAAVVASSGSVEDPQVSWPGTTEAPRPTLEPGVNVARYTVLAFVGHGAMGEVYAAYDPKLDRRVALKLLRGGGLADDERAEARLLREAQAIARLSHPNVISVHDAGSFNDRVFIAMEYVEGQTLTAWLAAQPRSREQILAVYIGAARGLAAAHAAGLVHRDFKPQNVMVGVDGTVRVTDFGLARRCGNVDSPDPECVEAMADGPINASLTRTGELIGTPLYMAPEQFQRRPVDARTDQFSFCVALYQALYREHPFLIGGGVAALMASVLAGQIRPAPPRTGVPLWLRRVLIRGLAVDAAQRWSSMDALAAALARDPRRHRRRWIAIAAGLVAASAATTVVAQRAQRPEVTCQRGGGRLTTIWPPASTNGTGVDRRHAIQTAFMATGVRYASETWIRVEHLLDSYAARWLHDHDDACQATDVRGEQSRSVRDLRMACLDSRLAALRSLTDLLVNADPPTVMAAIDAVNSLPPLAPCSDVRRLLGEVEAPRDAATGQRVDDLRQRAAEAKALHDTGHNDQADVRIRQLITEARQVGYGPLLAELLEMAGTFHTDGAFVASAVTTLEEAVWTGIRTKRDDVAVDAAALLVGMVGYDLHRPAEGERWATFAEALLDRLGEGHDLARAWVLQSRAVTLEEKGDFSGALRLTEQALALKRKTLAVDHPDIAPSLMTKAELLAKMGDYEGALEWNARARDLTVQAYGPGSPYGSSLLSNRGEYLDAMGRPAEGLTLFREALSSWEAALGPEHAFISYPLTGIGRSQLALGRAAEAVSPLRRALRIREANDMGPAERAETRFALAQALWRTGSRASGIEMADRARQEYASTPDAKHTAAVDQWLAQHKVAVR